MVRNGLHRHRRWVASSGNDKDSWYKTVFLSIRSFPLSSEERSLLWQTMHSDGRFGYWVRSEPWPVMLTALYVALSALTS